MAREVDRIIETELDLFSVPSKCVKRTPGGRHMRLVVEGPGTEGYMPYSLDCSGRGLLNFRADFRRFLRRLGFQYEPSPERLGSLGEAMLEAASRVVDPLMELVVVEAPPLVPPVPPAAALKPATKEKAMSDITTPSRSLLSQGEVAQITMLITQHANVDFSKKVCDYHPSWSDDRVWRMVAVGDRKHLTVESITKFRKSFFGATPEENKKRGEAQGNGNMSAMWRAINDLKARVESLEASATDPRDAAATNGAHTSHHNS